MVQTVCLDRVKTRSTKKFFQSVMLEIAESVISLGAVLGSDAATGKILAESDFLEPVTGYSLSPQGFGGRIYIPIAVGKRFYVPQVIPKTESSKNGKSQVIGTSAH